MTDIDMNPVPVEQEPILRIDNTWSIRYDPANNDRPTHWLRHGEVHSEFNENNGVVAMFYVLYGFGMN